MSGFKRADPLHGSAKIPQTVEDGAGLGQQEVSFRNRMQAAAAALEELITNGFLQARDQGADGWLREAHVMRRFGHRVGQHDLLKGPELLQFHSRLPFRRLIGEA